MLVVGKLVQVALLLFLFTQPDAQTTIHLMYVDTDKLPIVSLGGKSGLCPDIAAALNTVQNDFNFVFEVLPPQRLAYWSSESSSYLFIMFNIDWLEENKLSYRQSKPLLYSKEVFIAQKKPGRDESFFSGVGTVPMVGVLGFQYRFAGFNHDAEYLKRTFNMWMTRSEGMVIKMILAGHGEIGIVEECTLQLLKKEFPEDYSRLLVSKRADNEYTRSILIRKDSPVSPQQINSYLRIHKKNGTLDRIFARYGMKAPNF